MDSNSPCTKIAIDSKGLAEDVEKITRISQVYEKTLTLNTKEKPAAFVTGKPEVEAFRSIWESMLQQECSSKVHLFRGLRADSLIMAPSNPESFENMFITTTLRYFRSLPLQAIMRSAPELPEIETCQ